MINKVTNLQATEILTNSVLLAWDKAEGAIPYKIYKDGKGLEVTWENSTTIDKLRANTIYGFKVTALYEESESKPVSLNIRTKKEEI